jgi:predicted nucleic acid-binding protein
MPRTSASGPKADASVHLLDGDVLYALIDEAHVHHAPARQWFSGLPGGFATCPITQGTLALVRLVMRLGGHSVEQALALLGAVTANVKHHFWPDLLPYAQPLGSRAAAGVRSCLSRLRVLTLCPALSASSSPAASITSPRAVPSCCHVRWRTAR